jgi:hypothetical protein
MEQILGISIEIFSLKRPMHRERGLFRVNLKIDSCIAI